MAKTGKSSGPSAQLAHAASTLTAEVVPKAVFDRVTDLFVDWVGATLAARGARPIEAITAFADDMGPASGRSEVLLSAKTTSPYFAALVNGAASHFAEQDDLHNSSVLHPATVVFPAALAIAQHEGASGADFLLAAIAGYEVGVRVGQFLGRSHYRTFHTTGTAGTIAAAAAVGRLLRLDPEQMLNNFGSAGTQAAGLWEFLRDGADSKPLHTGKAAANGLMAACLARDGFTGAREIFEGSKGMGAGMSVDANPVWLLDGWGSRWAVLETSFKVHASCRHTHPAADALRLLLDEEGILPGEIVEVTVHVHQAAIDVLGDVTVPASVHQAKFSMGTTLGLLACRGSADMAIFETDFAAPDVQDFSRRVRMVLDPEIDAAYPKKWIGKVELTLKDGRRLLRLVRDPKGDPENTLTRPEIDRKVRSLNAFGGSLSSAALEKTLDDLWRIGTANRVGPLINHRV